MDTLADLGPLPDHGLVLGRHGFLFPGQRLAGKAPGRERQGTVFTHWVVAIAAQPPVAAAAIEGTGIAGVTTVTLHWAGVSPRETAIAVAAARQTVDDAMPILPDMPVVTAGVEPDLADLPRFAAVRLPVSLVGEAGRERVHVWRIVPRR